jgi:MFS family permease
MATYAISTLHMPPTVAMGATITTGVCLVIFSLLAGYYSDRIGRKKLMLIPRILLAVLTYPAFQLLVAFPTPMVLYSVSAFLAILLAITGAASLIAVPELFPRGIRATALSLTYAVGVALFGGTTQFIVTWLIGYTHNPQAPGLYVAVVSVITLFAMLALPETKDQSV